MTNYTYPCILDRVVDGDTMDVVVDLGFNISHKIRVRLAHFNAPEPRGDTREEGLKYCKWAAWWFEKHIREDMYITTKKSGKYGRWIGDIYYLEGTDTVGIRRYLHDHLYQKAIG